MRRAGRWAGERRLLPAAAALVAALPVILSVIRALASGWTPVGDDAVIALRAHDVLSTHPPLLGQFSQSSVLVKAGSYSLGPLLYWLLALPVRIASAAPLAVAMGIANGACAVGVVALARRRGGDALMVAAAAALVVMSGSLVNRVYSDVWNPAAGVMPFTLLIFLAWSLACGEYRLLPITALVASFTVQSHLTYVLPSLGMLAVAAAGLLTAPLLDRRELRRWSLWALLVLLVCWSAPLLDQVVHRPGNFVQLAKAAFSSHATAGATVGWHALVRAIGAPPWWVTVAHGPNDRFLDVLRSPGLLRSATCVAVLVALVVLGAAGRRAGRRDVTAACALALVVCAALPVVASSTPTAGLLGLTLGYTLWWGSPAGMFAWLALGWSIAVLVPAVRLRLARVRRPARTALAAAAAAVAVAALVRAGAGLDVLGSHYGPVKDLTARVRSQLPRGRAVLVEAGRNNGFDPLFDFETGLVYGLARDGVRVLTPSLAPSLGKHYDTRRHPYDLVLFVGHPGQRPPAGARVLARAHAGRSAVVAMLAPRPGP